MSVLRTAAVALAFFQPFAMAETNFQPIEKVMAAELEAKQLPSVSVTLVHQGKIVFDHALGFADTEQQLKATTSTPYATASVSKMFTTAAVMVLVERGEIDLDRPINEYLGEEKVQVHIGDPAMVTVRRVADHTAGLPMHYQFFYSDEPAKRPEMDESIRKFGHVVIPPGERFNYSNFGYGLLDYVIERESGQGYGDFLAATFFAPLGMENSATTTTLQRLDDVAVPYGPDGNAVAPYDFDHRGASAVFSSTRDLATFGSWFLGDMGKEGEFILSQGSRAEMVAADPAADGDQIYRLGVNVRRDFGHLIYSHSGNMPGVSATLTMLPEEDFVISVAINSSASGALPALSRVRDSAIALLDGRALPEMEEVSSNMPKPVAEVPEVLFGRWKGAIETDQKVLPLQLDIAADGILSARVEGGEPQALEYFGEQQGFHVLAIRTQTIPTSDAARFPHGTMLRLIPRDNHLNGAAAAFGPMALSYWVDLQREAGDE